VVVPIVSFKLLSCGDESRLGAADCTPGVLDSDVCFDSARIDSSRCVKTVVSSAGVLFADHAAAAL